MSFSSNQQDTSGSSTTSLDPQLASTLYGNIDRAQSLANTPFQPYTGQQVAAFTPTQLQAQNAERDRLPHPRPEHAPGPLYRRHLLGAGR
jgi:hypothetical protein